MTGLQIKIRLATDCAEIILPHIGISMGQLEKHEAGNRMGTRTETKTENWNGSCTKTAWAETTQNSKLSS